MFIKLNGMPEETNMLIVTKKHEGSVKISVNCTNWTPIRITNAHILKGAVCLNLEEMAVPLAGLLDMMNWN